MATFTDFYIKREIQSVLSEEIEQIASLDNQESFWEAFGLTEQHHDLGVDQRQKKQDFEAIKKNVIVSFDQLFKRWLAQTQNQHSSDEWSYSIVNNLLLKIKPQVQQVINDIAKQKATFTGKGRRWQLPQQQTPKFGGSVDTGSPSGFGGAIDTGTTQPSHSADTSSDSRFRVLNAINWAINRNQTPTAVRSLLGLKKEDDLFSALEREVQTVTGKSLEELGVDPTSIETWRNGLKKGRLPKNMRDELMDAINQEGE